MSLNSTTLAGRLTRDPELHVTKNGKEVASFDLAHNDRYKKDGVEHESTLYMRCTAWGPLALLVSKYLHKGDRVHVEGRLKQKEYMDREGKKQRSMYLDLRDVDFPEKEKGSTGAGQSSDDGAVFDDDTPF